MALDVTTAGLHREDHAALTKGFFDACYAFVESHGVEAVDKVLTDAVNECEQEAARIRNVIEHGHKAINDTTGARTINTVLHGDVDSTARILQNAFRSGALPSGSFETASFLSTKLEGLTL